MLPALKAARRLFIVFLIATIAACAGQARAAAIGAQVGLDRSGIDGDVPSGSEYLDKAGFLAGLQGEIGIAHDLSLSVQPTYAQKKGDIQFAPTTPEGSTTKFELAFDYVTVPILVKFAQAHGRTFVTGGFSADFLTKATLSGEGTDRDVKSAYKDTGVGALLGFGVVFPAGRTHLTAELRLVQGITNMTGGTVSEATGALAQRLHSSGVQLIVGSLFPIGKR